MKEKYIETIQKQNDEIKYYQNILDFYRGVLDNKFGGTLDLANAFERISKYGLANDYELGAYLAELTYDYIECDKVDIVSIVENKMSNEVESKINDILKDNDISDEIYFEIHSNYLATTTSLGAKYINILKKALKKNYSLFDSLSYEYKEFLKEADFNLYLEKKEILKNNNESLEYIDDLLLKEFKNIYGDLIPCNYPQQPFSDKAIIFSEPLLKEYAYSMKDYLLDLGYYITIFKNLEYIDNEYYGVAYSVDNQSLEEVNNYINKYNNYKFISQYLPIK